MKTLLLHKNAYERLRGVFSELAGAVDPIVIDDAGQFFRGEEMLAPEQVAPDAAWLNYDAYMTSTVGLLMKAALNSPRLEWLQSGAAGFDNPMFAAIVKRGATLTCQHTQSVGIADYVLWGALDHFQGGPARRLAQQEHRWDKSLFREIEGSIWLIVGFGAIGQDVAKRARAFGAQIIGVRRHAAPNLLTDRMISDWLVALPEADVVVLSLPLSATTKHMANAAAFEQFKTGSLFINVGRGALVDESALLSALDQARPAHAVLDVFEVEPLPPESPIWRHPRITLTAHCAGLGVGGPARADAVFIENLRRYARGAPLNDIADPKDVLASAQ